MHYLYTYFGNHSPLRISPLYRRRSRCLHLWTSTMAICILFSCRRAS